MIGSRRARVDDGTDEDTAASTRHRSRRRGGWWELPVLLVVAITVAVLLKTFVVQPFFIPSGSMERTLHGCPGCAGDRILTFKPVYSLSRDPHPGDIVVFRDPGGWDTVDPLPTPPHNPVLHALSWAGQFVGVVPPNERDLVKRVIAIGGQTVKCCDAGGNVQVGDDGPDGSFRSLDDGSYTYLSGDLPELGRQPFGPVTVPTGRLWVMGDHRDGSADSRAHCGSPSGTGVPCGDGSSATATSSTVPVSDVIGKAVVIAWPPSRWTTLGTPTTFGHDPLPSSAPDWAPPPVTLLPLGLGVLTATGWRRRRRRRRGRRADT